METIQLGKSGIEVTRLCLGTWQASGWERSDEKEFISIIRHGIAQGINFIDTAEGYGDGLSERLVAKAIEGEREKLIIATKFHHTNSSPEKLRKALERSLRNLQTDYIDLYQQHWPPKKPPLEETLDELQKLKTEGKIRAIGVSNWMEPEFEEVSNVDSIDSLQPCYSLLWRSVEKKILKLCREQSIAILPYSPLCQGLLARKITQTPNDHRSKNVVFKKSLEPVTEVLEEIAEKNNKTIAQVSLRWLLDTEGVSAPIVGATSKEQLDENLGALGWKLDEGDYQKLSNVTESFSEDLQPHDTLWRWHPRK